MAKAPFVLFVGDLHAGSRQSIRPDPQTKEQAVLLAHWKAVIARAKVEARGHEFWLMLGGDLIEGFHHESAEHYGGTLAEQREMAVALLQPLANMADKARAILGTEAHGGRLGEDDRTVARELGVKPEHIRRKHGEIIGGQLLWWFHQGPAPGRNARTEYNPVVAMLRDVRIYQALAGQPAPALIVWHHVHRTLAPLTVDGITAAICPCWQDQTYWAAQNWPLTRPDIGALAWWPEESRAVRWMP